MTARRVDWVAVLLAAGAGLHAGAVTTHREYLPYVAFFVTTAFLGTAAAVLVVARPNLRALRPLLVIGNLLLLGVWLATRTLGVPIGPEAGARHAVGLHDALAAGAALAAVVALTARPSTRRTNVKPRRLATQVGAVSVVLALSGWTGVALADAAHPHATEADASHHHGLDHAEPSHHHP